MLQGFECEFFGVMYGWGFDRLLALGLFWGGVRGLGRCVALLNASYVVWGYGWELLWSHQYYVVDDVDDAVGSFNVGCDRIGILDLVFFEI